MLSSCFFMGFALVIREDFHHPLVICEFCLWLFDELENLVRGGFYFLVVDGSRVAWVLRCTARVIWGMNDMEKMETCIGGCISVYRYCTVE